VPSKVHSWKFIEDKRRPVYKTVAAELDAVAKGKKPLSFFATDRRGYDEDLAEIQAAARKRTLTVTVVPRGRATSARDNQDIDIFVHRTETDPARRTVHERNVKALGELLQRSPWSFDHEAKLGELLGYSPAQRSAWLAAEHHARPAFGVITLYAEIVRGYPFPLTWFREPGRVPAPDAYKIMDKVVRGLELYRVGMDPAYEQHLDARGVVELAGAPKKVNTTFDKAMRTELEMLGPTGWQRPARRKKR
jgi:hypothetical protein